MDHAKTEISHRVSANLADGLGIDKVQGNKSSQTSIKWSSTVERVDQTMEKMLKNFEEDNDWECHL